MITVRKRLTQNPAERMDLVRLICQRNLNKIEVQ